VCVSSDGHAGVRPAMVANAARPATSSAAGSRVNKDAESLLRWGLPLEDKVTRDLQESIENIQDEIRMKRYSNGKSECNKAKMLISQKRKAILALVRPSAQKDAEQLLDELTQDLNQLLQVRSRGLLVALG
jgi:peptidylprolyl isomerase